MKFNAASWKTQAVTVAETAEMISGMADDKLSGLGDVAAAGATSDVCTLLDVAIASIYPPSVDSVRQIIGEIVEQLVNESIGLYETGQLYHDVEADNTLTAEQLAQALAETPYN